MLSRAYDTSPLTRKVAAVIAAERFAFSMSLMLESGIYIVDALHFAADLEESERAKTRIVELERLLGEGKPLQEAIFASGIFEESYNGMIVAGLRTGTPGTMLMEVALRCRRDAESRLQRLLAIIEPALVALLCVLVGLVILSVMLPLAGILSGM